jgi:hypothetical protein
MFLSVNYEAFAPMSGVQRLPSTETSVKRKRARRERPKTRPESRDREDIEMNVHEFDMAGVYGGAQISSSNAKKKPSLPVYDKPVKLRDDVWTESKLDENFLEFF